jgi:hypothetical protein
MGGCYGLGMQIGWGEGMCTEFWWGNLVENVYLGI